MSDRRIGRVTLDNRGKQGTWYESDPVKPIRVFVPGSEERVETVGSFVIRRRGDTEGRVMHTYRCEVHGEFDALVSRSDAPDAVWCSADDAGNVCGRESHWAGSRCGQGKAPGEVMS